MPLPILLATNPFFGYYLPVGAAISSRRVGLAEKFSRNETRRGMSYGIRVFRNEYGLSWMKARRAAKLFKSSQSKWPPELQQIVKSKSPSGAIRSFPQDLAKIVAEFVDARTPNE
jgi:hypothetical protein